jgi:hypothetical protein
MSGHYLYLRERTQRVLAANVGRLSESARQKIGVDKPEPVSQPRPALAVKPLFAKGRYVPASMDRIIAVVARLGYLNPAAIYGSGKRQHLVNARFAIANLAEEFAPHQSDRAVDDAMLRGVGCTSWYRERHRDRLEAYPDYAALYQRCHAELAQ